MELVSDKRDPRGFSHPLHHEGAVRGQQLSRNQEEVLTRHRVSRCLDHGLTHFQNSEESMSAVSATESRVLLQQPKGSSAVPNLFDPWIRKSP